MSLFSPFHPVVEMNTSNEVVQEWASERSKGLGHLAHTVTQVMGEGHEKECVAFCSPPKLFCPQVHRAPANDSAEAGGDSRDPSNNLSHREGIQMPWRALLTWEDSQEAGRLPWKRLNANLSSSQTTMEKPADN